MMNVIKPQQQEKHTNTRPGMITIPQAESEHFLIALRDIINDFEEMKSFSESLVKEKNIELDNFRKQTITKFNILIEATEELTGKLKSTSSYEAYLEERIKNSNLNKEVAMIEQQLEIQKSEITIFIKNIEKILKEDFLFAVEKIKNIESADTMIRESISELKNEMVNLITTYNDNCEKQTDETCEHILSSANNQFDFLSAKTTELLKNYTARCQNHLETLKTNSIAFLKECDRQNKELIKNIPEIKTKLSWKDIYIMGSGLITILGMIYVFFK